VAYKTALELKEALKKKDLHKEASFRRQDRKEEEQIYGTEFC